MSTKIYDAYRIPKKRDILKDLVKAKDIVIDIASNSENFLKMLHMASIFRAQEEVNKDPSNIIAKGALEDHVKGDLDIFWLQNSIEVIDNKSERGIINCKFTLSVFYDEDYWYLKFYVNGKMHRDSLNLIEKELKLEDYHYQNQVDPPEDIHEDEYYSRGEKWDELTKSSGGNYRNGFQFTLFDAYDLGKLISKNYYKGLKTNDELYSHLAYKFDVIKKT